MKYPYEIIEKIQALEGYTVTHVRKEDGAYTFDVGLENIGICIRLVFDDIGNYTFWHPTYDKGHDACYKRIAATLFDKLRIPLHKQYVKVSRKHTEADTVDVMGHESAYCYSYLVGPPDPSARNKLTGPEALKWSPLYTVTLQERGNDFDRYDVRVNGTTIDVSVTVYGVNSVKIVMPIIPRWIGDGIVSVMKEVMCLR